MRFDRVQARWAMAFDAPGAIHPKRQCRLGVVLGAVPRRWKCPRAGSSLFALAGLRWPIPHTGLPAATNLPHRGLDSPPAFRIAHLRLPAQQCPPHGSQSTQPNQRPTRRTQQFSVVLNLSGTVKPPGFRSSQATLIKLGRLPAATPEQQQQDRGL